MELDEEQIKAVEECCNKEHRVVAVTGGPGTGKTTILRKVNEVLRNAGYSTHVSAPTGKAAKRIYELTGIQATTIHRMLEYGLPTIDEETGKEILIAGPGRHRGKKLDVGVILIDEYAMVNLELHSEIIDAMARDTRLCVFGDINQLPPIDMAAKDESPFKRLLRISRSVTLTHNYRQGAGSGIIENSRRILRGQPPTRLDDFTIVITNEPLRHITKMIDDGIVDFKSLDNQIIVSGNKSDYGVRMLNAKLQQRFMPETDGWLRLPRNRWEKDQVVRIRQGDKIVCTANDYTVGFFNGEMGHVIEIDELGNVVLNLGDRIVTVPPRAEGRGLNKKVVVYDPRRAIDRGYAITTHKAQGSEFKHALYIVHKKLAYCQSRPNTYTAVTRGREHVTFVSDQLSLTKCLQMETPMQQKSNQRR
jgi:exodeoxyribonuclease V alpha subunit